MNMSLKDEMSAYLAFVNRLECKSTLNENDCNEILKKWVILGDAQERHIAGKEHIRDDLVRRRLAGDMSGEEFFREYQTRLDYAQYLPVLSEFDALHSVAYDFLRADPKDVELRRRLLHELKLSLQQCQESAAASRLFQENV